VHSEQYGIFIGVFQEVIECHSRSGSKGLGPKPNASMVGDCMVGDSAAVSYTVGHVAEQDQDSRPAATDVRPILGPVNVRLGVTVKFAVQILQHIDAIPHDRLSHDWLPSCLSWCSDKAYRAGSSPQLPRENQISRLR